MQSLMVLITCPQAGQLWWPSELLPVTHRDTDTPVCVVTLASCHGNQIVLCGHSSHAWHYIWFSSWGWTAPVELQSNGAIWQIVLHRSHRGATTTPHRQRQPTSTSGRWCCSLSPYWPVLASVSPSSSLSTTGWRYTTSATTSWRHLHSPISCDLSSSCQWPLLSLYLVCVHPSTSIILAKFLSTAPYNLHSSSSFNWLLFNAWLRRAYVQ